MDDNISNLNFLKETVTKFKGEIQKMITTGNTSSANVIQLKQTVEEIEKSINNREKQIVSNFLTSKKCHTAKKMMYVPRSLPRISQPQSHVMTYYPEEQVYTSVKYTKQSTLDRLQDHKKNREINIEKETFKKNMTKRHIKGEFQSQNEMRMMAFNHDKETRRLLGKYNINSKFFDNLKIPSFMPNYMNKQKLLQYSSVNRKYHNDILYDNMKQPIIKKDELEKGLLNMIYKGLIPKGADLTPAFESNGHPLQMNKRVKEDFTKVDDCKDEIDNQQGLDRFKADLRAEDNFFITKPLDNHNFHELPSSINDKKDTSLNKIESQREQEMKIKGESFSINLTNKEYQHRKTLIFYNYCVTTNEEYEHFHEENLDKWGSIVYLFDYLTKLFKKLNLTLIEIYQDKLVELASDEMRIIQNKDLLMCISDRDLKNKGLDPSVPNEFYNNIKECFAVKIQLAFRSFQSRKKLKAIQSYFEKIRKIQTIYKSSLLITKARNRAKDLFEERYNDWKNMMTKFKARWDIIKSLPHVEIHFNSISTNSSNSIYLNTTRNKFLERENNQINRIINLNDPNVEIIYISPHDINNDIISYYSSILGTLGVDNVKERFHIIVPSARKTLPPHYSISQLLLLSPDTLNIIKQIIGKRDSFIIPGNGGKIEVELSMLLNVPILMGDLFQTEASFTKSGAKLIFEANDLPVPLSAWDLKTEYEFYASLAHLICSYLDINVWIFKMDHESNGRGIAYIQLDKITQFLELRRMYSGNNSYQSVEQQSNQQERFEQSVSEMLKRILPKKVKIVTSLLYKSWEDYYHDFLKYRGVIEACPTSHPNNIKGSPCIPILIKPNGSIESLPTFDKINCGLFRNVAAISPQRTFKSSELEEVALKLGKYLYEHNIIGYVTLECIVFHQGDNNNIYWAVDLKFGLSDMITSINFCHFLYLKAVDRMQIPEFNISLNQDKSSSFVMNKCDVFAIPFFSHSKIAELKINDLVKSFRTENLIFDIEKKRGVIFNFSDVLQCGSMGICGILNTDELESKAEMIEFWKMVQVSCRIMAIALKLNDYQPNMIYDQRTDLIEVNEIFNKMYKCANQIGTDKDKVHKTQGLLFLKK